MGPACRPWRRRCLSFPSAGTAAMGWARFAHPRGLSGPRSGQYDNGHVRRRCRRRRRSRRWGRGTSGMATVAEARRARRKGWACSRCCFGTRSPVFLPGRCFSVQLRCPPRDHNARPRAAQGRRCLPYPHTAILSADCPSSKSPQI